MTFPSTNVVASNQHGWVIRIGLEVTQLPPIAGVVELLEAVVTEEGGALRGQLVLQGHPEGREYVAHQTEPTFPKVHQERFRVV